MDAVQLRDFLVSIFDQEDLIEVRMLPSRKQLWCNGPDEVCAVDFDEYLRERNLAGENIYIGANPRATTGGKASNVALARCLFVDFDNMDLAEAKRRIEAAGLPEPTAYVLSGGGVHAWWRLDEPITDMALWTSTQKAVIRAVRADPSIHDPPRIMRLPGYRNVKRDAMSVVAELSGRRASLADFPAGGPEPLRLIGDQKGISGPDHLSAAPFDGAQLVPALTRATVAFLTGSIPEGERNRELFKAAADVKACGMEASLRQGLVDAAYRHGLGAEEINLTINSAFSKEREPAKLVAVVAPAQVTLDSRSTHTHNTPVVVRSPGLKDKTIANYNIGPTRGEGEKMRQSFSARSYDDIYADVQRYTGGDTGGGVRRVGTTLFAKGEDTPAGYCPNGNSIKWFPGPNELFPWIGKRCNLKWKKEVPDAMEGGNHTLPTKSELFGWFQQEAPDYYGIELLPHEPKMPGLYYAGGGFGDSDGWKPPPGEGKLWELIDRLNYATDIDRVLLAAMFLTPGWGGPPGARPAFVLDSPGFGQGTGKTTTADLLCDIWGLALTIGHDEKMEDLQKRLLSIGAVGKRVALLDNVKGRKDSAGLESIVTAKEITGHRLYVGNTSRPNLLTYVVTANVPRLSKDLADRSIIIHVGRQRHADSGFMDWARNFVVENRASIIGDAMETLAGPTVCQIPTEGRDRWGGWQDAVLARLVGGDRASIEAKARRKVADVDTEDAEDIADAIRAYISLTLKDWGEPDSIGVRFTPGTMLKVLVDAGAVPDNMSVKGLATILIGMCGVGPCALLGRVRDMKGKYWTWGKPEGKAWKDAPEPNTNNTGWRG